VHAGFVQDDHPGMLEREFVNVRMYGLLPPDRGRESKCRGSKPAGTFSYTASETSFSISTAREAP